MGESRFPVYYEDTDLSGFVYHANYLKYFERAREQIIGISFLKSLWDQGVHFVVSECQLKYRFPAKHGDEIIVRTQVSYSQSPALYCQQIAYVNTGKQEQTVVEGQITLVTLNAKHKPIRLPESVIQAFQAH
ncbi:acyl-CoA thioester hydrolase [Pseudobacteriovorax antillogorgiicola]|uniref:Acyl-CoA thioester hydrolase n=1 Tax=Pseudobacteriovorax antillogorgiicola TaxID=1513793 RepID=A0A1Y6CQN7_9BACT|nr:acyl-CoA thioester hydrolase [Pseudobacteriovorax antillogorgiicola]SMF71362.1 acyl-CoA thioester hydrolase [Pseudobacteriovorax antillogorgiicola]